VTPPGDAFELPAWPTAAGAPQIFEHSQEAGPDETLFLVGTNLTKDVVVWGHHPDNPGGKAVQAKVQLATDGYLAVTVPDHAFDGPLVLAVKNAAGYSEPITLNAPQPWWSMQAAVTQTSGWLGSSVSEGATLRVFGRNLSCRPDGRKAWVWLCAPGKPGRWLMVTEVSKYTLTCSLPADLEPGPYELWVHGGRGGARGWGGPLRLAVSKPYARSKAEKRLKAGDDIQSALETLAERGGGTVRVPAGHFPFTGTLRVPANVTLCGAGRDRTTLELVTSPAASFSRFEASGWGLAPGAIHTPGDTMTYDILVPQSGRWNVWLRYGTDMSPWKQAGVSGKSTLQVDGGAPVTLENLPNTGGFGVFKWVQSAVLDIQAGKHTLVWKNTGGGGMSLDAFVLMHGAQSGTGVPPVKERGTGVSPVKERGTGVSPVEERGTGVSPVEDHGRDAPATETAPSDTPYPTNTATCIVIQGESCVRFACKDGLLPRSNRAVVWLSGDRAALADLTVLGNAQINQGIAIRAATQGQWVSGCQVRRVRIADCEGKQAENCGVYVRNLRGGKICDNELWGRTPLFLSGVRQTELARNRLVSVTRYGGNSEAAILGRTEPVEECVIEGNVVASPPGAEAGGPTARRLIWLSTGHGSVAHNWLAGNGVEAAGQAGQARFGGVAGTDQNVGEMILFEGNHRTMYFGPLSGADAQGVNLPATLPPTPDARLGSVKREQLAHDAEGRETPFWPPDADDGTDEPPLGEYYVTVFAGPGQGQTRRVTGRAGERLAVDRPWRVAPQAGSVVAVGTMFYRNLIVGNHVPDGMTGIQLWISCVENVIAGNTIARQRKPGLFLYANSSTLASSMPRTWNRGVSPLFWNLAEGNRTEECSDGALVTSGDAPGLPIEFPRALGNVLRHNSFVRSRQNGVIVTSRKSESAADTSASVVGTVVELNVVRDAPVAYHVAQGCDGVVLRRNHAYAWHPVNNATNAAVAFQLDSPDTRFALEANTVEGKAGVKDATITEVKKSLEK
jgi:hypothetical protein